MLLLTFFSLVRIFAAGLLTLFLLSLSKNHPTKIVKQANVAAK
jgi:hypothetical protein